MASRTIRDNDTGPKPGPAPPSKLGRLANVVMYFGVFCLAVAALAFTTPLPSPLREIGEYCFYGWWIPFIGGYVLRRIAAYNASRTA